MGKTLIKNLDEFCGELFRKTAHLRKYLEWEMGISIDEKNTCTSNISKEDLDKCLFTFLEHFVICEKCIQLDTTIIAPDEPEETEVYFKCNQCHHNTIVRYEKLADLVRSEPRIKQKSS